MSRKVLIPSIIHAILLIIAGNANLFAQEDLMKAVSKRDNEALKALLAKGANPNAKSYKETILSYSLNQGFDDISTTLINAKGIKINEWSMQDWPTYTHKFAHLHRAVKSVDMLKLLLDKGALINAQDAYFMTSSEPDQYGGNTALMLSLEYPASAKFLINRGTNLNIQNVNGVTALMSAVSNLEIVQLLVEKGAKLDIQSKGGQTALMCAAPKYPQTVKYLIEKGANIMLREGTDQATRNAMDCAAEAGNIESAKIILAKAVSMGKKEEVISGALLWAVVANQLKMAEYLLDEGANIEGTDMRGKYSMLMVTPHLEMVQMLVRRGANVNAQSTFGYTPLYKAVSNFMVADPKESDCEKIMNLLLEKGAKVDMPDGNGNTALLAAVQKITPTKILIAKGANVNHQNKKKETALMLAVKGGLVKVVILVPVVGPFKESVKLLISKGADINLQDEEGKTALMHAAGALNAVGNSYSAYTDILGFLIEKGAKLEIEDKAKNTALFWAQKYNRDKSADLLIAKGAKSAKKYVKTDDKANISSGIVGTWLKTFKVDKDTYTYKVIFNADWTYSKALKAPNMDWMPDNGGYKRYEFRDGRIFLFNFTPIPAVLEWRFEGKTLILNGEKFTKAGAK